MAVLERVKTQQQDSGAGLILGAAAATIIGGGIWWYKTQRQQAPAAAELDLPALTEMNLADLPVLAETNLANPNPEDERIILGLAKPPEAELTPKMSIRQRRRTEGGVTVL